MRKCQLQWFFQALRLKFFTSLKKVIQQHFNSMPKSFFYSFKMEHRVLGVLFNNISGQACVVCFLLLWERLRHFRGY